MAIETIFADGFDGYSTVADMDDFGRWYAIDGSRTQISTSYGRNGTVGMRSTGVDQYPEQVAQLLTQPALVVGGFAYKTRSDNTACYIAGLTAVDVSPTATGAYGYADFAIYEDSSGRLCAYTDDTLLETGTTVLSRSTWYYIEFRAYRHDTAGTYEVRIDEGSAELSGSSQDLKRNGTSDYWGYFSFWHSTAGTDDLYLRGDSADTAGGYFGDVYVESVVPNANGTNRDFTLSTGTDDYAVLDEMPPSFTDYAYSSTTGHQVSCGFEDVSGTDAIKSAVFYYALAVDPVGGNRQHKPLCRSNSVDYPGTAAETPDSRYRVTAYDVDPNTSSAWTVSALNAAEFGLEVQSA